MVSGSSQGDSRAGSRLILRRCLSKGVEKTGAGSVLCATILPGSKNRLTARP